MKRFACSLLYLSEKHSLTNQIVEIGDNGIVNDIFPLKQEERNTIWIGGVIIIRDSHAWHYPGVTISCFKYSTVGGNLLK